MKIKESSLRNLKPNKSHWKNSETCVIRVPKQLKDEILDYAKRIDAQADYIKTKKSTVTLDQLESIIEKIKNKDKGYKSNSASQLIKDLLRLIN